MFPRPSGASLLHAACSQPSAVNPVHQPLAPFEKEVLLCRLVTQGPSQLPWGIRGILSAFLLWKATTTIANTKERFKGPCEAVTSILLRWGGGGGPAGPEPASQVVEFQQGLVESLVDLHVLLLGTGQGLCEGKQHVRRGGETRGVMGDGGTGRHNHEGIGGSRARGRWTD